MRASARDENPIPPVDEDGATPAVDERVRRVGSNEAVFREVNERIEELNHHFAAAGEETVQIVCECGKLSCAAMLPVPIAEYERVRCDATLFLVIAGHEDAGVEDVVDGSPGTFNVVRKRGAAREIARATDPRAGRRHVTSAHHSTAEAERQGHARSAGAGGEATRSV